MRWNPKYFIVYPYQMIDELHRPDGWGYLCAGNLSDALREILKIQRIGSEIKWIINSQHKWQLIKDYDLQPNDIDDYAKANCSILSFKTEKAMKKASDALKKMGAKSDFVCVDSYRDVILQQASHLRTGAFVADA